MVGHSSPAATTRSIDGGRKAAAEKLPVITTPTLMVWGLEDSALGRQTTDGTDRHVDNLTMRFLPDVSHWVQQEAPETVNAMLLSWRDCCVVGEPACGEPHVMRRRRSCPPIDLSASAFSGYRFPPEVIVLAVRWYLRYGLSYRDLEELLAERGVEVDHVTLFRWVQRFTPLLVDAARPCRHAVGGRWFVDETYVKVAGVWRYVYRAVDEDGQVIDVYVSARRDLAAARRFFTAALRAHGRPEEVVTDLAQALETVIEELTPRTYHNTEQYANNRIECDHGRLKARLRPMRGLKTDRTAQVVIAGHAFMQNLRRGHYELGVEAQPRLRVAAAFHEISQTI